jgi:hypothetical protein
MCGHVKLLAKIGVRISRKKVMAKRKIYSQGVFDGACFLYSLANAVRSVTRQAIPEENWARSIAKLPFSTQDLLGGSGTEKLDHAPGALLLAAQMFVKELRDDVLVSEIAGAPTAIVEALSSRRAVVAAIANGNHWVALLEVSGSDAYYACSWVLHKGTEYSERLSPGKRTYNARKPLKKLGLWDGPAFVLSLKS